MTVDGDRSAALLVRVWLESDSGQVFRGRLTAVDTTPALRVGEVATVAVVSSADDVVVAVRAWLDDVLGGGPDGGTGGG